MNRNIITSLALSLLLTIVFEAIVFLLAKKRDKKDFALLILVNVLTNPAVVLLHRLSIVYTSLNSRAILVLLELFAIVTEGYCYKKYGRTFKQPYAFSVTANMFSYWTGVLLQFIAFTLLFRR